MQSTNILPQNWKTTLSKVLAKTWIDESFRQRFVQEPLAILKDAGLIMEDSIKVIVNVGSKAGGTVSLQESENSHLYVELPCKPNDLEEEEISLWSATMSEASSIYQPTAST